MKDMSINQKKWAEGISKRNLVRLYFSFRQLHVPRETKIEPDRRLNHVIPYHCLGGGGREGERGSCIKKIYLMEIVFLDMEKDLKSASIILLRIVGSRDIFLAYC